MLKKRIALTLFIIIPVLAWMLVIFVLSSQPAQSSNKSSRNLAGIAVKAAALLPGMADNVKDSDMRGNIDRLNDLLREAAHAAVYFILAVLVMFAAEKGGLKRKRALLPAFAICAAYSVSDEIHQLYVPGRTFQGGDLLMDSAGIVLGLAVYTQLIRIKFVRRGRRH